MSDQPLSEAGAALAWAQAHLPQDKIDLGHDRILVRERTIDPHQMTFSDRWVEHSTRDPNKLPDAPDRVVGTTLVYTPTSYVDAVKRYENEQQITYVDQPNSQLVTVLNPPWPLDGKDDWDPAEPGHGDHRVALALQHTPEYLAWRDGQGLSEQATFARRMQDGELEILEPTAATMLEIAETFHATSESKFKSAKRLQDGRRQFVFEEDTSAKAGENGQVEIPERFKVSMPVYVGGDRYTFECRLSWELRPKFRIGYKLIRPEVVLDHAFASIAGEVTGNIDGLVLNAPVPR